MKTRVSCAAVSVAVLLLLAAPSAQAGAWERCGNSYGTFPVYGFKPIRAEVQGIKARYVRCPKARRFAHRLFFKQNCVRCDAPSNYLPGERVRFRGFACKVTYDRNFDQFFRCRRGNKRINFATEVFV